MYFDRYTFCPDYLQMPLPAHRYSLYMLFGMHSFIHEKYTYNIISHERQAICKGTEVIGTIHDVGKPYAVIKLKYLLGKQKYTCVDLLTNCNWGIYNRKCIKVLVHLIT